MDKESLWNVVRALPPSARQQVTDFVAFLRSRYSAQTQRAAKDSTLKDDPFVGMWADQPDMADSDAWVRSLRSDEWQRRRE